VKTRLIACIIALLGVIQPLYADISIQNNGESSEEQPLSAKGAGANISLNLAATPATPAAPAAPAKAHTEASVNPISSPRLTSNTMTSLPMVVLTLVGLVALIFLLGWLAKRFGGLSMIKNKDMQILSSLSLGARERATLIEVNGTKLLLGVTTQTVTCLHTFEANGVSKQEIGSHGGPGVSESALGEPSPIESDFSSKLQSLLQEGREAVGQQRTDAGKEGRSDV
jgi:flagellar biosynthetic protein FliO